MSGGIARAAAPAASSPSPGADGPKVRATSDLLPRRPYPGLRPFEKAEWPIFRGRDRLIQDILTVLAENHFASIIGPSGSGKSSLVRAGVLATLERRHSRMGVRWRTGTMRPGVAPLWSMAEGILRSLRPELVAADGELPAAEVARLRVLVDSSDDGLAVLTREFALEEHENFLLLVDQFEEIFRYRSDEDDGERARLVELLVAVADARPPGLYIITTMRSEYLGDCARFTGLAEILNETHYLLPRMTEEELRQAIVEPAELKDGLIEDDLVARLINDVRSQEDQLPILQHTLLWLWIQEEERREREGSGDDAPIRLDLAAYEQLEAGKGARRAESVKNALSRHGDRILDRMSPEERKVAEIMFRRMVEVEEHSNRLRRPTRCGTVARLAQAPLDVVQNVVDAFRADDASFIYANRQRVTEDTSVDIMHESLIRQWETLDRWVRRETASYEVYNDLCRAAQRMQDGQGTLLAGLALSRARHWLYEEQPTRLWARRYGGDFDAAIAFLTASEEAEDARLSQEREAAEAARRQEEEKLRLQNELEQQTLRARLEEQTKLARERRRFTRLAVAAAAVLAIVSAVAVTGFVQARTEATRAEAASFWHRLQLFGDPLNADAVAALWDLSQQDEAVRAEFVRQLAGDRGLLRRFGFKPQPIARAVGLRWPEEARQIGMDSVAYVASEQFRAESLSPFELIAYTRAVAALAPRLEPALAEGATQNITQAIGALVEDRELTDRQLWALAEMVGVMGERLEPGVLAAARDRLRQEIAATAPGEGDDWRRRALGRAIELTAPELGAEHRLQAARYLVPLLGQDIESWSSKAIPRALNALLPLVATEAPRIAGAMPRAIARAAVARADQDNAYLLALMQVAETFGGMDDPAAAALGRALAGQLLLSNERQSAALARAALPVLARQNDATPALVARVAGVTLVPEATGEGLDPMQRSHLRRAALRTAEAALRQALPAPGEETKAAQPEAALEILHRDWSEQADGGRDPYRLAAQARLLGLLAPALGQESAALAATDLLGLLPRTENYLAREAIARALAALALRLPDAEREAALLDAKVALAKTGSTEEASAWAGAVAALLPADPEAATAVVAEALKYPTATEAPSDILLAALATRWPQAHEAIADRTLPDQALLEWLEAHLPDDHSLAAVPTPPPGLHAADPSPERE